MFQGQRRVSQSQEGVRESGENDVVHSYPSQTTLGHAPRGIVPGSARAGPGGWSGGIWAEVPEYGL